MRLEEKLTRWLCKILIHFRPKPGTDIYLYFVRCQRLENIRLSHKVRDQFGGSKSDLMAEPILMILTKTGGLRFRDCKRATIPGRRRILFEIHRLYPIYKTDMFLHTPKKHIVIY